MSKQKPDREIPERYFVFIPSEDGGIELVIWFNTLEEAQAEAQKMKKKFPEDRKITYVGENLTIPKPDKPKRKAFKPDWGMPH